MLLNAYSTGSYRQNQVPSRHRLGENSLVSAFETDIMVVAMSGAVKRESVTAVLLEIIKASDKQGGLT